MQIRHEVTGLRLATLAVIAALFAPAVDINAEGQWLTNQTPGIPRTADGKIDLTAPAPRWADGKPDLSGVWRFDGSRDTGPAARTYLDGVTPPLQPWAEALAKTRATGDGKDDPTALCLPLGHPRSVAFSMQKIVQTPTLVVVLYEFFTTFRQIFVDGRKLPVDPQPAWGGYSVGRWEGDTLVVETAGFNDRSWLDSFHGYPLTDSLRLTERMRRVDFGHLDVRVTIDDPKAYTRPFDVTVSLLFQDTELIEYVCNENEKFVTPAGRR